MEYLAEKIAGVDTKVDRLDSKFDKFIEAADTKYVQHQELNAIKSDVDSMKADRAKLAWIIISAVFVAILALVLNR